jgi:hypothetical protein
MSYQDARTNWSRFAHIQYVTTPEYLCDSVMLLERLQIPRAKASRLMLYPREWDVDGMSGDFPVAELVLKASEEFGVELMPIHVHQPDKNEKIKTIANSTRQPDAQLER